MTTVPINKPTVLANAASVWNDVTIITCPNPATTGDPNTGNFTVNDCATLAAANSGNALLTIPFATLFQLVSSYTRAPIAGSGATSNGLVVSSIPGGVSVNIRYGE
jgi:hypothetical protein